MNIRAEADKVRELMEELVDPANMTITDAQAFYGEIKDDIEMVLEALASDVARQAKDG